MSGMTLPRPRSLSALVLVGVAIIALPLIAALIGAGVQMQHLSESSRRIVTDGVTATRLTRELFALRADLERRTQFYATLLDPDLLPAYATQNANILRAMPEPLIVRTPVSGRRVAIDGGTQVRPWSCRLAGHQPMRRWTQNAPRPG